MKIEFSELPFVKGIDGNVDKISYIKRDKNVSICWTEKSDYEIPGYSYCVTMPQSLTLSAFLLRRKAKQFKDTNDRKNIVDTGEQFGIPNAFNPNGFNKEVGVVYKRYGVSEWKNNDELIPYRIMSYNPNGGFMRQPIEQNEYDNISYTDFYGKKSPTFYDEEVSRELYYNPFNSYVNEVEQGYKK